MGIGDSEIAPGRADVPVGMANENANVNAGNVVSLAPHSQAGEDASVPRAGEDASTPGRSPGGTGGGRFRQ